MRISFITQNFNQHKINSEKKQQSQAFSSAISRDTYSFAAKINPKNPSFGWGVMDANHVAKDAAKFLNYIVSPNATCEQEILQYVLLLKKRLKEFESVGLDIFKPEAERVVELLKDGKVIRKEYLMNQAVRITRYKPEAKGLTHSKDADRYLLDTSIFKKEGDMFPLLRFSRDMKSFTIGSPDLNYELRGRYRGDYTENIHIDKIENLQKAILRFRVKGKQPRLVEKPDGTVVKQIKIKKVDDTTLILSPTPGHRRIVIKRLNSSDEPEANNLIFSPNDGDILDKMKAQLALYEKGETTHTKSLAAQLRTVLEKLEKTDDYFMPTRNSDAPRWIPSFQYGELPHYPELTPPVV